MREGSVRRDVVATSSSTRDKGGRKSNESRRPFREGTHPARRGGEYRRASAREEEEARDVVSVPLKQFECLN